MERKRKFIDRRLFLIKCMHAHYIDFGNFENLPYKNIYEFPKGVEMMAPGSVEVLTYKRMPLENPGKMSNGGVYIV